MSRKYDAVIFDLDGVICHTDKYHYLAWKTVADKLGVYFDEKINNRLRGVSRMQSLDIILENYQEPLTQDEKEALAEEKNNLYRVYLEQMSTIDLDAGVKKTLEELRAGGYKLAIGSSSKNTPLILEKIGLKNFFDAISDGNNITQSKPAPEVFLKAAEFLGIAPKLCIVIEDAVVGIEAAAAAGMGSAAMGDASSAPKATYTISGVPALAEILL